MQLGICAGPAELGTLTEMPFDFFEGHVQNLLIPDKPEADFAPLAASVRSAPKPMPSANCFVPGDLKVTGPDANLARLSRHAETAFARAAALGVRTIIFGSGAARQIPEGCPAARGFEQWIDALKLIAPMAQRHDVMVAIEPLNRGECNLVNTIDEGAESVLRCGHPNVQLLVDIFHMLRNGESPDAISRHARLIVHAHVAEAGRRSQPGVDGDDFRPFLKALRQAERCQRLALECIWVGSLREALPAALRSLRRQMADAGY